MMIAPGFPLFYHVAASPSLSGRHVSLRGDANDFPRGVPITILACLPPNHGRSEAVLGYRLFLLFSPG